jgi:hypothetical protein
MPPRLLIAASVLVLAGCAHGRRPGSYFPVGAPAQYGDRTADGIVLLLSAPESAVRTAVTRALAANGYALEPTARERERVESTARGTGGDTTLVVRADITREDPSGGGVVVVVSGEYSVSASGIRRARVVQRPGEQNPLYGRLRQVADSIRRFSTPAP